MGLKVTQINRAGQNIDLRATIVDIVLARHLIAGEIQHRGQSIAKYRTAGVAHMQWTGGVGRDIFNIHLDARANCGAPITRGICQNCPQNIGPKL